MTLLFGLFVGTVLVLAGVGLGTVGATVIGMSKLADLQKQAGAGAPGLPAHPGKPGPSGQPGSSGQSGQPGKPSGAVPSTGSKSAPGSGSPVPGKEQARSTLGIEAVDAPKGAGAVVVGVHVPGPGYTAGLVRGDVLVALGATHVGSAADLARAVAAAPPAAAVTLTVLHADGSRQRLSTTPGVVT
jgi:S1-C subfamily serine protease